MVCRYFKMLALKWLLNYLNPSSMEKVMVIFLRLCRLNWNYVRLCSTLFLGILQCESCSVSKIKVLVDIMSFSYMGFTSYLEVRSERYGFSYADHQMVTWVNTELCDIWKYFHKFLYNYGSVSYTHLTLPTKRIV